MVCKMKVLFVVKKIIFHEYFGIMYLSAILKGAGHKTDLLVVDKMDVDRKLKEYNPDILAYSITTGIHKYYLDLNRKIKAKFNIPSVFGGPHCTFFPETIKEEGVDILLMGESEYAFLDVVNAMEKGEKVDNISNVVVLKEGRIKINPVRPLVEDLDSIPFPDRDIIYKYSNLGKLKINGFFSGRGCPYACTYCFNHKINELYKGKGRIVRKRSVDNFIEEVLEVKKRYPLGFVRIMDDTFILSTDEWLEEFAEKFKTKVGLPFFCMVRANLVNEKNARLLAKAGCISVAMGIESGDDEIRNAVMKRNITKRQMIDAARLLHKNKIKIMSENILGLPSGSLEKDLKTLKLNIRCRIDFALASIFQPYPKTELAEFAIKGGYFDGNYKKIEESYRFGSVLNFSEKEKRQIKNLQDLFGITVAFPWMLPITKILIKLPLNRLYHYIYLIWRAYCSYLKMYPHKTTLKDKWLLFRTMTMRDD